MVAMARLTWPEAKEDGQGKAPPGTAEKSQKEEQVGKRKPLGKRHDWIETCLQLLKHTSKVAVAIPACL